MPTQLLWVNKDASSLRLTRNVGRSETKIRRHVQKMRALRVCEPVPLGSIPCQDRQQPANCVLIAATANAGPDHFGFNHSHHSMTLYANLSSPHAMLSHRERQSFCFFTSFTASAWSGWVDELFWRSTVLRACEGNVGIRHGVMSLAAKHESTLHGHRDTRKSLQCFGLKQRDIAVEHFISQERRSYSELLVACIVLLCVQNAHHGHHAFHILQAGQNILSMWEQQIPPRALRSAEQTQSFEQLQQLFSRLQSRMCMMIDPVATLSNTIAYQQLPMLQTAVAKSPNIPDMFTTLLQARNCLEEIFDWCMYQHGCEALPQVSPPRWQSRCDLWMQTLEKMELKSKNVDLDTSLHRTKALLRAACLFGVVMFQMSSSSSELDYDRHEHIYDEILRLVEQPVDTHRASPSDSQISFGIDDGLVDMLTFVGVKCRNPKIRRKAMHMLLHSDRAEGGRLSLTAGLLVQAIIHKEEEGLPQVVSAADIPESRRRRVIRGEQYFSQRKICLRTLRRPESANRDDCDIEEAFWIDLPKQIQVVDPVQGDDPCIAQRPDTIFERGRISFLSNTGSQEYKFITADKFYFPILKT